MIDLDAIKSAIDSSQRAQRNYDLTKHVSKEHLNLLIYAATNSPSKQNETHFSVHVYTEPKIIRQIYDNTKKFTLGAKKALAEGKTEEWLYENQALKNSQILADVLFVYTEAEGNARGATHHKAKADDDFSKIVLEEQKNYSIGISVGELILTAGLLGYKTGICSAFNPDPVSEILNTKSKSKLLVGVGVDNPSIDRLLHAETTNAEVPEDYRTGALDEKWKFYSFKKNMQCFLNGLSLTN